MHQATIAVHFELYALRQGRWVMDACFADEDEAQAAALRARHGADVRGVRVLRELNLPGTSEPVVTVVYDSTQAQETLVFKPAEAAETRPAMAVPAGHQRDRHHRRVDHEAAQRAMPSLALAPRLGYVLGFTGLATVAVVGVAMLL